MSRSPAFSGSANRTMTALDIVPVVPSDTVDLAIEARAIRCRPESGAGGTLRITTYQGNVRDTEIATGEMLVVGVVRVHLTGTTATGLEAVI